MLRHAADRKSQMHPDNKASSQETSPKRTMFLRHAADRQKLNAVTEEDGSRE